MEVEQEQLAVHTFMIKGFESNNGTKRSHLQSYLISHRWNVEAKISSGLLSIYFFKIFVVINSVAATQSHIEIGIV